MYPSDNLQRNSFPIALILFSDFDSLFWCENRKIMIVMEYVLTVNLK